jgi:hypothetical protein
MSNQFKTADQLGMSVARYDILVNSWRLAVSNRSEVLVAKLEDILTGLTPDTPRKPTAAKPAAARRRRGATRSRIPDHPWAEDEE